MFRDVSERTKASLAQYPMDPAGQTGFIVSY